MRNELPQTDAFFTWHWSIENESFPCSILLSLNFEANETNFYGNCSCFASKSKRSAGEMEPSILAKLGAILEDHYQLEVPLQEEKQWLLQFPYSSSKVPDLTMLNR